MVLGPALSRQQELGLGEMSIFLTMEDALSTRGKEGEIVNRLDRTSPDKLSNTLRITGHASFFGLGDHNRMLGIEQGHPGSVPSGSGQECNQFPMLGDHTYF
jgi:hypothetical protein